MARRTLLRLAKVWAYPLWLSARHTGVLDVVKYDANRWVDCIGDDDLTPLDPYSRFAFLAGALPEFRTLMHYRLRPASVPLRLILRVLYRGERTMILEADTIGPGLFIQHGVGALIGVERIGRDCWINQQVSIGYDKSGCPTIGDNVTIGAGAIVVGRIIVHDGATIGANATVIHDVPPGEVLVAPLARPLREAKKRGDVD